MRIRRAARLAVATVLTLVIACAMAPAATAVALPSAPRSVAAKAGNASVRVTWVPPLSDGGSPVNRYDVQRAASSGGPWSSVAKPAGTTFAWKNTGLVNGTRYYYRVLAHNAAGWGAASTVVSAVPRTVPSAPLSPAASPGDGSATVSWTAPASNGGAPVNAYRVQLSTDGATWTNLSAGAQTQLTPGGLPNGTEYRFRVRAHNAAGWGPPSVEVRTTPGLPLPPTNLVGHSTASGVDFSWTPSATVSPAVIEYQSQLSNDGTTWTSWSDFDPQSTGYGLSTGQYGVPQYLRLRSANSVGFSEWVSASAVLGLPPGAVGNLKVTYYGSPFFWNSVGWSAPTAGSPVQGYHVERIVTEGPYQFVTNVGAVAFPSYVDQGVSHTTDYWYRVTPYNQVGDGPSSVVHITTP